MKASDYLKKPVDLDELQLNIEKVLSKAHLSRQLEFSRKRESHASEGVEFIGEAPQINDIRTQVQRIGQLCPDIDTIPPTILILGETGTGKDVAARLLHGHSRRAGRPFVQMDCAALPRDLIEAELFGHEKGAFTNASSARIGLVEAAEDGVLFIDEIGELPLELQAKLLATLERRTLRRVGSNQERPVKAWFISATNRDLEQMVRDGQFRSDLYYRLNVLSLAMPPLRQRGRDIERLARTFCEQNTRRYGLQPVELTDTAVQALHDYAWPGNVRELKHSMEQAVLLSGGGRIDASAFMFNQRVSPEQGGITNQQLQGMTLDEAEFQLLKAALERTHNNVSESARQLGVTRMAMRYRMKKYNL
jgi:DNA-binding NtrC family response regulator